ncbi:MAG: hypothetical protein JRH06_02305, partial [Deltaproteobacteria bacterium]|nr:hypothetical protein [Deltaproteobacteria bacterium]MBW2136371.1 hypothetical protein [Deltaproteobacteria bacterium]
MIGKKKHSFPFVKALPLFVFLILFTLAATPVSFGAEDDEGKKDLPPRAVAMLPEYTGVILPEGEDLNLDIEVFNRGRQDESINLSLLSVPEGWKARIKTYSFDVRGVSVKSDDSKTLTLKAEPDKDVKPGDYKFVIQAKTEDGA